MGLHLLGVSTVLILKLFSNQDKARLVQPEHSASGKEGEKTKKRKMQPNPSGDVESSTVRTTSQTDAEKSKAPAGRVVQVTPVSSVVVQDGHLSSENRLAHSSPLKGSWVIAAYYDSHFSCSET